MSYRADVKMTEFIFHASCVIAWFALDGLSAGVVSIVLLLSIANCDDFFRDPEIIAPVRV